MSNQPTTVQIPARTVPAVIEALRFGTLTDDLTSELKKLVMAVQSTEKSGTLTLTLKLKPGKAGQIEIEDDIKVKAPKEERGTSLMFATVEGNLQREDPRQMSLPGLKSVDTTIGELRNVG